MYAPRGSSLDALEQLTWSELLAQSPLRPDSQNLFASSANPICLVEELVSPVGPDGVINDWVPVARS